MKKKISNIIWLWHYHRDTAPIGHPQQSMQKLVLFFLSQSISKLSFHFCVKMMMIVMPHDFSHFFSCKNNFDCCLHWQWWKKWKDSVQGAPESEPRQEACFSSAPASSQDQIVSGRVDRAELWWTAKKGVSKQTQTCGAKWPRAWRRAIRRKTSRSFLVHVILT